MATQGNIALVRALYDEYNNRDFNHAASLVSQDYDLLNVPHNVHFHGPEGAKEFLQDWATAFPDSKVEIKNIFSNGDKVVVEFTGRGTHTGPFKNPTHTIQATGRKIDSSFCDVHQIQRGKIASTHVYYDMMTMMRQLGLAPEGCGAM